MKKTIYFVRHGESEGNAGPLRQGASTPLSELGRKQVAVVAERCAKLPIDVLISSTMTRAKETAETIFQKIDKPIEYSDLFVERRPAGAVVNQPKDSELVQSFERALKEKFHLPGFRHSDEENFDDIKERAGKALDFLANRQEENMLVVTHGMFMKVLLAYVVHGETLTGDECRDFFRAFLGNENTGITALKYDDGRDPRWRLWIWNDHAHLG